jgi:hydroxymethylpyrimidine/phosphomethylpyrimidine kinase
MPAPVTLPRALTIAGSDSGGGAGIQADLKTFTVLGAYGMCAITSVTAQNTTGVYGVHDLPPEFVAHQVDLVAQDIGVDAAKTGMLSSTAIVEAVADAVKRNGIERLVVDPVMVAKSGDALLQEAARDALAQRLLPLAYVVTPNIPEAEALTAVTIADRDGIEEAARRIRDLGPRYVLIKGGHGEGPEAVDWLYDGEGFTPLSAPRRHTLNTHGTGCTYSAAIAAYLAQRVATTQAIQLAHRFVATAIETAPDLGAGHGPLNHLWPLQGK